MKAGISAARMEQQALRMSDTECALRMSEDAADKAIHYRMHPANVACLTAAEIDCCGLANNHALDWGSAGLLETLRTLRRVGIRTTGAGRGRSEAETPAAVSVTGAGSILVFSYGSPTSGVPRGWAAQHDKAGVAALPDLSPASAHRLAALARAMRQPGDVIVLSLHWGGNWGYAIPPEQRAFTHRLITEGGADIVHGHSSHHPKGIEVFEDKPILYGCGDFLNDYEGISGYEEFRSQLVLMYFVTMGRASASLTEFEMTPLEIGRFRLNRVSQRDARWLRDRLEREGASLGTHVKLNDRSGLTLRWS